MKPKNTTHNKTIALPNGGFLHIDRAIMPIQWKRKKAKPSNPPEK